MSTEHHHYGSVSVAVSVDRLNRAAHSRPASARKPSTQLSGARYERRF